MCSQTFYFCKYFRTVLTEEIYTAKFSTELFVMSKHSMTKLNIPKSSSYMSRLRAIVLCQQHCRITVDVEKKLGTPSLRKMGFTLFSAV